MKKKKMEVATPGFDLHPNFLKPKSAASDHYTKISLKLIVLKYFSLPFTLFEPCRAVFIMNSKIHLSKSTSKRDDFKTISHYLRVYSLSGFI